MPSINTILLNNSNIIFTGNYTFNSPEDVVFVYMQMTGKYSQNIEERHPIKMGGLFSE
jgi:hypothetical protein